MYTLASNANWMLDHYNLDGLIVPPIPPHFFRKKFSYLLTVQNSPPFLLKTIEYLRNVLKIDYPLFDVERQDNHLEIFVFCTHPFNQDIINFYLNHQPLLNQFKEFFHQKAKILIKESSRHPLFLPNAKLPAINWNDTDNIFIEA